MRYAVVGLGYMAQGAILPALAHAGNSRLRALVSDDPVKRENLGKKYDAAHTWGYQECEDCLQRGDVDAVFIALPNSMQ